jgi:putative transposase
MAEGLPSFLEPRRRAEQALVSVVQEAYVNGVSARILDLHRHRLHEIEAAASSFRRSSQVGDEFARAGRSLPP